VINGLTAEEVTCGEASVTRADDDRADALDGRSYSATSTVTSVGLVSASNTADRFCD
jgi:hypothetical protein